MASKDEIDRAIGAHGLWKARLRQAIDTGQLDVPVDAIRVDTRCAFGQWLCGPSLGPADHASPHYRAVRDLHAEFHRTAARVAELALAGRKAQAEAMLALAGEYAAVSGRLTSAMIHWKKSLG